MRRGSPPARAAHAHDGVTRQRRSARCERRLRGRIRRALAPGDDQEADAAGIALARRTASPAAACSWERTTTCWRRSPRRGVDGALVALVDLDVVGYGAELRHGFARTRREPCARLRRTRRAPPRAPRAISGARRRRRARARECEASRPSASRLAARDAAAPTPARRDRHAGRPAPHAPAQAPPPRRPVRRPPSVLRCRGRSRSTSSLPSCSPIRARAAAACSIACRSAVAAFTAANTSLRAASTSASSPSIVRCAMRVALFLARTSASAACSRSPPARAAGGTALFELVRAPARAARRAPRAPSRSPWPQPPSLSTCCLSNTTCCCRRPIDSSRACAASRAAVVRASASVSSSRSRSSERLDLRQMRGSRGLARARVRKPRARSLDRLAEQRDTAARTAPSPIGAALRAVACSAGPWRPGA